MTYVNQDEKIRFIQENVTELAKFDPYTDRSGLDELKRKLHAAGHYKMGAWSAIHDSAVINLVLRAQGKKRSRRSKKTNHLQYKREYFPVVEAP
jgi:hypothetical protein